MLQYIYEIMCCILLDTFISNIDLKQIILSSLTLRKSFFWKNVLPEERRSLIMQIKKWHVVYFIFLIRYWASAMIKDKVLSPQEK